MSNIEKIINDAWKIKDQINPDSDKSIINAVKEMINLSFERIGMTLEWSGEGVDTIATDNNGIVRVRTNPKFFRPAEVDPLIGDFSLAAEKLGWEPKTTFEQLVQMMVDSDMKIVEEALANGLTPPVPPA